MTTANAQTKEVLVKEPLVKVPVVSRQTKSIFTTTAVVASAYAVLELIRHGLVEGYVLPWLMSVTTMGPAALAYIAWALVFLSIVAISYLIYKYLIAEK